MTYRGMKSRDPLNTPTRRGLLKTVAVGLTGTLGTGLFGSTAARGSGSTGGSDPTVITEPIRITEPGTYVLESDLKRDVTEEPSRSDDAPFIEIGEGIGGEVIVDGHDQTIAGQGSGTGLVALETSGEEVTVRNLTFCNCQRGVYSEVAGSLTLEDVTITRCESAISYHDSSQLTGDDLTITENETGIDSTGSEVTLTGSTITDNEGVGLHVTQPAVSDTTISRNGTGVAVHSGNGSITGCTIQHNDGNGVETTDSAVTVTDSQISKNGRHGLQVLSGKDWKIHRNRINRNGDYGVYMGGSNGTLVIDNTIVGNGTGPVFISDDSGGNIVALIRTKGESPIDRGDGDDNGSDDGNNDEQE